MNRPEKPFTVKGQRLVSPKGNAKWCHIQEPDRSFEPLGDYKVDLVCDPDDPTVKAFIDKLEKLRDQAFIETKGNLKGAKAKQLNKAEVFKEEEDQEGELTGNVIFKFKLGKVDNRKKGQDRVSVIDADRNVIAVQDIPLIGNGSVIRCKAYVNPYYMASTVTVGVSLIWEVVQIIDLVEYGGGSTTDGFDDEDGYTSVSEEASGFDDEGDQEDDF